MAIIVSSPHNGIPVKVRDQDVGRAVRDNEGRIFYVLAKSDGMGHYGSLTRSGGDKAERRALDMTEAQSSPASASHQTAIAPHDATGSRRKTSWRGVMVIVVLAVVVAVLAYLFSPIGPYGWNTIQRGITPKPNPIQVGPTVPPKKESV